MVFQLLLELELLAVNKLQLQLELTDAYFSVITGFQLQLLLTGITLLFSRVADRQKDRRRVKHILPYRAIWAHMGR